jgi:hypothetical protein
MMSIICRVSIGLCLVSAWAWTPVHAAPQNLCALFTTSVVQTLLGTAVESGETAAMGTGVSGSGKTKNPMRSFKPSALTSGSTLSGLQAMSRFPNSDSVHTHTRI